MKKILVICTIILIVLSVTACGKSEDETPKTPNNSDTGEVNVYSTLIELLRGEIETLKKEQSETKAEYEAKIEELEKQLSAVSGTAGEKEENADKPGESSPFTYEVKNGTAEITGYSGKYSVLVIPDTIDGYTITSIADSVFSGNTNLTSVSLPKDLKTLGWFAFSGCTALKSATLPVSISEIGYDAFAHCTKLTIYCEKGSYAEKFAESYGISCVAN